MKIQKFADKLSDVKPPSSFLYHPISPKARLQKFIQKNETIVSKIEAMLGNNKKTPLIKNKK
jgi:hypothetical protein